MIAFLFPQYQFSEFKGNIVQLISVVMNSVNSHQHDLCINIPPDETMLLVDAANNKPVAKKFRTAKKPRIRGGGSKRKQKLEPSASKTNNDESDLREEEDTFEMSSFRLEALSADAAGISETETVS